MSLHLSVSHSVHRAVYTPRQIPPPRQIPQGKQPPLRQTAPPQADTPPPEMVTEAGGTHPTGMHSCVGIIFMYALFTVTTTIRTNLSGSYSIALLQDDTAVILGDEHDVKRLRQYTIPNGQEVCVVDVNDNLAEITEIKLAGKVCLAISYR